MEDVCENIDKKYDIIEKKGSGATSIVYLVKDSITKKIYAAKILKKQNICFNYEIEMLNALKNAEKEENQYILNLVNNGTGDVVKKDKVLKDKQYLILEYASKGSLINYMKQFEQGLKKEYAKVIFAKILRGVLCCHNHGICHRDLKLENILLDENFNPKIADFGYATYNTGKLIDLAGTPGYAAPEIYEENKLYDGYKADIFSLGVILYNLYTGRKPFIEALKNDSFYKFIVDRNYRKFWTKITGRLKGIKDTEDFKNFKYLFNKMISYRPKYRPTINDILKSEWMKEIRVLNEDQLKKLEEEIIEEFLKIEPTVNKVLKLEAKLYPIESLNNDRGIGNNSKKYFDLSLKPKYAKTGLGMNFIKIEGNLSPAVFMNNLANKIDQIFKDNCKIEESKVALKFNITFEEELKDEEEISKELEEKLDELDIEENEGNVENEENEENEGNVENEENEENKGNEEIDINSLKKDCIMECKLYQSFNGGHILKFSKKNGYLEDYYNNLEIIISLVKEILNFK